MTEAPKRIWIQPGEGADFWWPRAEDVCPDDGVAYVRADIADEMLEALHAVDMTATVETNPNALAKVQAAIAKAECKEKETDQ